MIGKDKKDEEFSGTLRSVRSTVVELIDHIDELLARGIALSPTAGLAKGDVVTGYGRTIDVPIGEELLGRDVLLLIDNIFRFIQAGMELSGLMGRLPSRLGYQPTLATELAELEERIASSRHGTITSIQAVYVPADDLTDPAA